MKFMLMRMFVLACVLLCGTSARGQVPNPFVFSPGGGAVSADLNGDGRADLVKGGTVFLSKADGTFTQGITIDLGSEFNQNCAVNVCPIAFTVIAAADFTGDGKPDVALITQDGLLEVLPGNGDGTFGSPKSTNVGILGDVQVADVNGDGKLDVIGVALGQLVTVCLGNGDGTFRTSNPFAVFPGVAIRELAVGDFNGDGKPDIAAAANTGGTTGSVGILLGNGDGTFATTAISSAGVYFANGIGAADFNGDGKTDLIVAGEQFSDNSQQTYLLAGKGDGTFQAPAVVAPGSGTVSVADLNGDGKSDAILWTNPFIEVLLANANGTFTQKATYPNGSSRPGFPQTVADFNGDGKLDISDGQSVIFGNGDGTFQDVSAGIINLTGALSQTLTTVTTGDFNGDGKSDLALGSQGAPSEIYIMLGDGAGHYKLANAYSVSAPPVDLQTSDFNGDKKADLVFSTENSDHTNSMQVMLGNGDGSFAAAVSSSIGPGDAGEEFGPLFGIADFNGDGFPDIAALENGQLAVLIGAGDGTFQPPVSYFGGPTLTTSGVGDFNGDGKADAVVCGAAGPVVLFGNGDGTLQNATFQNSSPSSGPFFCSTGGVADFNNDGLSDLLLNGGVALSNGDGTFAEAFNFPGTPVVAVTIADMNEDGKPDLVGSDGTSVFLGNGDGTFMSQTSFLPAWIDALIWANSNDQTNYVTTHAVFAVADFGSGLPGIAMIAQAPPGGEISLPSPLAAPAPDFLFSATLPGVLAPGGQTILTVKSKAIGGFHTDVASSCEGLPAGLTCSFAPATLTAGAGQATVTLAASSSATIGTYPITLTGTAGGVSHDQQRAITIAGSAGATNANLRPLTVSFSAQMVGGAMATQTATLSNVGSAILQISNVSIAGSNASDFSVSSNSCGTSVAAFSNCQIVVAFSPTATGARSATLMVSDNATGGLQVVSLSGNGQDFGVGVGSSGGSATVAAGKAASYSLSVAGSVGFSGNVSLSCSGAPTAATCAVSPTTVMVSGGTAATATVTVTTTARSEIVTPTASRDDRGSPWTFGPPRVVAIYAVGLALSVGLMGIFGSRPQRRMSWVAVAGGVLLFAGLAVSGCGGGGGSSTSTGGGTAPPPSGGTATGTPAGSYTITMTATTGSGGNAVSHTTKLTLVVQ